MPTPDDSDSQRNERRLKKFAVTKLFGLFTHEIEFRMQDRMTILHGPNGVGKTTVLRLIEALPDPNSSLWSGTQFEKVSAEFLPDGQLTIEPLPAGGVNNPESGIRYVLTTAEGRHEEDFRALELDSLPLHVFDEMVPYLHRVDEFVWRDSRHGDLLDPREVLERYRARFPDDFALPPVPDWLSKFFAGLSTQFIQTQRLRMRAPVDPRRSARGQTQHAVERLAEELVRKMRERVRQSGALGASLDRTFPRRLLESTLPPEATEEKIRAAYQELEELRKRLMDAALLDTEEQVPLPDNELSKDERKVLWHYLADVRQKLGVHQALLDRVELFKRIIDEKNFLYKQMKLDKRTGFSFVSEVGSEVPLSVLSSGEQHELVLAYELLFNSEGKRLILIDEPELSLHVSWQQMFLADMEEIARLADLDFIIATHSPSIVTHHTNLMVELAGSGDA